MSTEALRRRARMWRRRATAAACYTLALVLLFVPLSHGRGPSWLAAMAIWLLLLLGIAAAHGDGR